MNHIQPLPVILVVTEGYTELIFVDHLRKRNMGCSLIVKKAPRTKQNEVVKRCTALVREHKLNLKKGDRAYCVFDWDKADNNLLKKAVEDATKKGYKVILSKPCFEIVFLAHKNAKISDLQDQNDTLERLQKHIENYSKTTDYWDDLKEYQDLARKKLGDYKFDVGTDFEALPNGSNIFELIDDIQTMEENSPKPK